MRCCGRVASNDTYESRAMIVLPYLYGPFQVTSTADIGLEALELDTLLEMTHCVDEIYDTYLSASNLMSVYLNQKKRLRFSTDVIFKRYALVYSKNSKYFSKGSSE